VIRECRPSAVLHFAAYCSVDESGKQPLKYYMNNVVGTLNLLAAMHENGVRDIVFSSTCATYGNPEKYRFGSFTLKIRLIPMAQ
jgi:UDP-glucose 4-epimerase